MGSMFNITSTGDSVWNYLDTAFTFASNLLYDAVELPSGSIIACGYSRTTNILKDWAWLVKVSKDGCVDSKPPTNPTPPPPGIAFARLFGGDCSFACQSAC